MVFIEIISAQAELHYGEEAATHLAYSTAFEGKETALQFPIHVNLPSKAILVPHCLHLPSFVPGVVDTQSSAAREKELVSKMVSRLNCVVSVVHFRQTTFDDSLEDVRAALHWAIRSSRRFGADRNKIFFSAVGYSCSLAAAVAILDASDDVARFSQAANKAGRIKGLIFYSPILKHPRDWSEEDWVEGSELDRTQFFNAFTSFDPQNRPSPLASPLLALDKDLVRLQGGPSAVFTSPSDPFHHQAEQWQAAMKRNDVQCHFKRSYEGGFRSVIYEASELDLGDQIDLVERVLWDSVYFPLLE